MPQRWLSALLLSMAMWFATPDSLAAAEHPFVLTPQLKAQLAQLDVLRGADFDPLDFGGKAVLVGFFASWCVPCRKGFIEQRKLLDRLGRDRLKILAVNWFEDATRYPGESMRLNRLLDRITPGITALEGNQAVYDAFGRFRGLPAIFVFDRTGREIYRFMYLGGPGNVNADYQTIRTLLEALS